MQNITIAIDGFSSTGKSTIAKQVANKLGYRYVDSGAMYRAVTLFAMRQGYISLGAFNVNDFVMVLDDIQLDFVFNDDLGFSEIHLNGENVEKEIRTMEVSNLVSTIAAVPEVRYQMVKKQHAMGKNKGIVMDGRDIGTVVFPEAELKIFMTASPDIRAKRRYDELIARGESVEFDEVLKNVRERDYIDSNRKDSPLVKAEGAVEIDNSDLTLESQLEKVMTLVSETLDRVNGQ